MHSNQDRIRKRFRRVRLPLITRRRRDRKPLRSAAVSTPGADARPGPAPVQRPVNVDGPVARALNYADDARTVDAAKRFSNRYCNNCALYSGTAEAEWAKCSTFPGKAVAGLGWCNAWATQQRS